ncbi:MAG TPA: hypothetical protein VIM79_26090 [Niastella sp.]
MGAGSFNIEVNGDELLIKKTRRALVSDLVWFTIFIAAMATILGLLYLYISIKVNPLHVFLFGMLFLFMGMLYYKNKVNGAVIRIIKKEDRYWIGNEFAFDVNERKALVVYDTAEGPLSDFSGNIYLKVKTSEYPLCSGATEEDLHEIKLKLELYFGEQL